MAAPREPFGLRLMRRLDLLLLALALPLFIAAGFPLLGWGGGAGAYLLQLLVRVLLVRRAERSQDVRTTMGLLAGNLIARGWLVALIIFGVGLIDADSGVAAATLFLAVFTVQLTMSLILRPFDTTRETP